MVVGSVGSTDFLGSKMHSQSKPKPDFLPISLLPAVSFVETDDIYFTDIGYPVVRRELRSLWGIHIPYIFPVQ